MSARNAESGPSAGPLELLHVYFLAPLLLSLACQLYWLKPILDEDEQVTALTAMSDPAALWRWFHFDITHPPLHVLTLHNWIRFAGHSDSSLRAMSMLSSVVTLALFYLLARRFLPRSGAALACLLQGCSVFYVFYAREARPFSLTALWGIATLYLLTGIDGAVTTRRAVTYFLLCVGLVYSSYVGLLLIIAELLWIGFRVAADRPKLLIAGIAAALTVAPWAWTMMWPYDGLLMAHLSRLMPGPYDARWADIGAFYAHAVAGTFLRRTAYFLLPVAAVAIAPAARRLMAESKLQLLVLSAALPVVTFHACLPMGDATPRRLRCRICAARGHRIVRTSQHCAAAHAYRRATRRVGAHDDSLGSPLSLGRVLHHPSGKSEGQRIRRNKNRTPHAPG
jgi:hypothetical protein